MELVVVTTSPLFVFAACYEINMFCSVCSTVVGNKGVVATSFPVFAACYENNM